MDTTNKNPQNPNANLDKPETAKKQVRGNVATKDSDISALAATVAEVWLSKKDFTLLWKDSSTFKSETEAYTLLLDNKNDTGKDRPSITQSLIKCNSALDKGIVHLKKVIDADISDEKEAKAAYAKFGIVFENRTYRLPVERNKRLFAIKLLLPALEAAGYTKSNTSGTPYFTPLIKEYTTLLNLANSTDKDVSSIIGNKNEQKKNISKVLTALIRLIQANYPDTYKSELRAWGFQREKF